MSLIIERKIVNFFFRSSRKNDAACTKKIEIQKKKPQEQKKKKREKTRSKNGK